MKMSKVKQLSFCAMFVALNIICSRFLYVYTPGNLDRLSLAFVPAAMCGLMLGPVWSGLTAMSADVLGMLMNSAGLAFNPVFTIIAGVKGVLYGLLLYKKPLTFQRIVLVFVVTTLAVDFFLNPLALTMYYGRAFWAIVLAKLPVQAIFLVVKIAVFWILKKPIERVIEKAAK